MKTNFIFYVTMCLCCVSCLVMGFSVYKAYDYVNTIRATKDYECRGLAVDTIREEYCYATDNMPIYDINNYIFATYRTNGDLYFNIDKLELGENIIPVTIKLGEESMEREFVVNYLAYDDTEGVQFDVLGYESVDDGVDFNLRVTNNTDNALKGISHAFIKVYTSAGVQVDDFFLAESFISSLDPHSSVEVTVTLTKQRSLNYVFFKNNPSDKVSFEVIYEVK